MLFMTKLIKESDKILTKSKPKADIVDDLDDTQIDQFLTINEKMSQDYLSNNANFSSLDISAEDFITLLSNCSSTEEQSVLFKLMKDKLPQIITNLSAFTEIIHLIK